jgi:hypothetical protein
LAYINKRDSTERTAVDVTWRTNTNLATYLIHILGAHATQEQRRALELPEEDLADPNMAAYPTAYKTLRGAIHAAIKCAKLPTQIDRELASKLDAKTPTILMAAAAHGDLLTTSLIINAMYLEPSIERLQYIFTKNSSGQNAIDIARTQKVTQDPVITYLVFYKEKLFRDAPK